MRTTVRSLARTERKARRRLETDIAADTAVALRHACPVCGAHAGDVCVETADGTPHAVRAA